jgi:hypothetical protein
MTRTRILQVAAYLLLAAACAFAIHLSSQAASQARKSLAEGARQAVTVSCNADKQTATALRQALYGQKEFIKENPEPPPPTTEQRLEALDGLISSIPIPNCAARVKLITDNSDAE